MKGKGFAFCIAAAAAAVAAAAVALFGMASAAAQERVGVNSAVNPEVSGTPPGGTARRLVLGQPVVFNERIATTAAGQTQILFLDESAMTVGPNSDVIIDQFVYDPKAGRGRLDMSMTRGVLRFIGGRLSKEANGVTLRTPSATLAVRGEVFLADQAPGGRLDAYFLYGGNRGELSVTGTNGITQTLRRPGFAITVAAPGAAPSPPYPAPPAALARLLAALDGRPGGTGGAPSPPSDAAVAGSGISADISFQPLPQPVGPAPVNVANLQTTLQVNTVQSQGTPVIALLESNPSLATAPTMAPPSQVTRTSYPVAVFLAFNPTTVFSGQINTRSVAAEPVTAVLQNGVLTATGSNAAVSFPLAPGNNNFGPQGTTISIGGVLGTLSGSSFLAPDNAFFYAAATSPNFPDRIGIAAGGIPTVTLPTTGIGSYNGSVTGLVDNNGSIYAANGSFTNVYNFATNSGNFTISNFDGNTLTASVAAVGSRVGSPTVSGAAALGTTLPSNIGNLVYTGTLSGSGLTGGVAGAFFGDGAADTGGVFGVRSPSRSYSAGGLFGGHR